MNSALRFASLVLVAAIPVTLLVLNDAWQLVAYNHWLNQEVSIEQGEATAAPSDVPWFVAAGTTMRVIDSTTSSSVIPVVSISAVILSCRLLAHSRAEAAMAPTASAV